ncbi:MAG: hypothetical protein AAGA08_10010 [Pseudomonadota bacterium]
MPVVIFPLYNRIPKPGPSDYDISSRGIGAERRAIRSLDQFEFGLCDADVMGGLLKFLRSRFVHVRSDSPAIMTFCDPHARTRAGFDACSHDGFLPLSHSCAEHPAPTPPHQAEHTEKAAPAWLCGTNPGLQASIGFGYAISRPARLRQQVRRIKRDAPPTLCLSQRSKETAATSSGRGRMKNAAHPPTFATKNPREKPVCYRQQTVWRNGA